MDPGKDTIAKVERQLQANCPSPEEQLIRLSKLAADLPADQLGATVRFLVVDIDDLVAQARWHLGQALILLETQPDLLAPEQPVEDPIERMAQEMVVPTKALLLLRGYIERADKVLFGDLAEPRRGGTVAGWVYHMMIDNVVYRVIAALDRVAYLVWCAADLPRTNKNGGTVRVYFRSGKMDTVHSKLRSAYSRALLDLSSSPFVEFVTDYRDSLAHTFKQYSKTAGVRPTDSWVEQNGQGFRVEPSSWDASSLLALGNATYHQLLDALGPALAICEARWQTTELGERDRTP